jgi:hypothetical protein
VGSEETPAATCRATRCCTSAATPKCF